MPIPEVRNRLVEILKAGMTDEVDSEELYYVKTWYSGDPIRFSFDELPVGLVISEAPNRVDQYVQLDTEIGNFRVYVFPKTFGLLHAG